ncbi:unnamed protein product [Amaranthus hypochondriacus]
MGSCVSSINKTSRSAKPDQVMSVDKSSSSMPSTPVKDKPYVPVDPPIIPVSKSRVSPFNSVSSLRSIGGSKDEAFFDTQGWLDSDCDDDFYSVNGDFTPSRGNTPVHASGTPRLSRVFSPQVSRAVFEGKPPMRSASNRSRSSSSVRRSFSSTLTQETGPISEVAGGPNPDTSTKPKSKKLADLFRESMRERDGVGLTVTSPLPPKSENRAPSALRYSVSSTDIVDDNLAVKDKPAKHKHRCFPRLVYVRSFSESKRTSTPPTSMNGDLKA